MTSSLAAVAAVTPAPSPILSTGAGSAAGQPTGSEGAFGRELERQSGRAHRADGASPQETGGTRRAAVRGPANPKAERLPRQAAAQHPAAAADASSTADRQQEPDRGLEDLAADVAEGAAVLAGPGAVMGAAETVAGAVADIGQWMAQLIDGAQGTASAEAAAQAAGAAAASAGANGTQIRTAPAGVGPDGLPGSPAAGLAGPVGFASSAAGLEAAGPADTGRAELRTRGPRAEVSPAQAQAGMPTADGAAARRGGSARTAAPPTNPQAPQPCAEGLLPALRSAMQEALGQVPAERSRSRAGEGPASAVSAAGQMAAPPLPGNELPIALPPASPVAEAQVASPPGTPEFAAAIGTQVVRFLRDGIEHARLQLHPADLGPVAVQLAVDGNRVQVDLVAEMAVTRQALEQGLPALAGALREAGFTLSGGGVFQQAPDRGNGESGRESAAASRRAGPRGSVSPADGVAAAPARARRPAGLVDTFA